MVLFVSIYATLLILSILDGRGGVALETADMMQTITTTRTGNSGTENESIRNGHDAEVFIDRTMWINVWVLAKIQPETSG